MHVHAKSLQWCQLFKTIWTRACQTPLSMGFSRQKDWSGLPCLPPGDRPDPGMEHVYPVLQPPGKSSDNIHYLHIIILETVLGRLEG